MIGDNEVYVIDDFLDKEYQEKIKNTLLGGDESYIDDDFPWHFTEDITAAGDDDSQHRSALAHNYVEIQDDDVDDVTQLYGVVNSKFHSLFMPLLRKAAIKFNMKHVDVLQGRSFLQFPLNLKDQTVDTPHIDIEDLKHLVVLYYVCDSDGDTIIYNEREEKNSYTIKRKVTPKQGRVVLFDGLLMHTAEQPKNNIRCIVNYNLVPQNAINF